MTNRNGRDVFEEVYIYIYMYFDLMTNRDVFGEVNSYLPKKKRNYINTPNPTADSNP
jgi:hypothetical protein